MCEAQCQGIVECVGNAVNEAAHDEKRYAKEQWQPHLLSCKVHYGGHNESTENSEKGNIPGMVTICMHGNMLVRIKKGGFY